MNKFAKIGLALAAGAAVAFASGCAANAPAYQCGKVDYKSMASCKSTTNCKGMTTKKGHGHKAAQ
jgi:hypothetical protein